MYSFLKAFLVLMKLLSLSQFYAPKFYESVIKNSVEFCYFAKPFCHKKS